MDLHQTLFNASAVWSVVTLCESLTLRVLGYPIRFLHDEEEKINLSSLSILHCFLEFICYSWAGGGHVM